MQASTGDGGQVGFVFGVRFEKSDGFRARDGSGSAGDGIGDGDGLVVRVHQCRHRGRRIRAKLQRRTNQGNGYFRGHVRINSLGQEIDECWGRQKEGYDRLHPEVVLIQTETGDTQVDRRSPAGGGKQAEPGRRSRLEGEVQGVWGVSLWKPSVAQADEVGFSFALASCQVQ